MESQIGQNLRADSHFMLKLPLALDGGMGHEFTGVGKQLAAIDANAHARLMQVDQHAAPFRRDALER